MQVINKNFTITNEKGGYTPAIHTITFPDSTEKVSTVYSAIQSFNLQFSNGEHNVKEISIVTSAEIINESTADVLVEVTLADENYDDPYSAIIDVVVIAY